MEPRTLTAEDIAAGVERLANAIREKTGRQTIALVGIRSRGDEVAERVLNLLSEDDRELVFGVLDISLYRDDFEHLHENPASRKATSRFPSKAPTSSSWTTCFSPAAPSAPRSTPCPTTAARARSNWPCSSTAATAKCRSSRIMSASLSTRAASIMYWSRSKGPTEWIEVRIVEKEIP
jgi:hypothetical protein